ncbi:MAG: arylsulfatase, partial [Planctomycetota bacterium]
AHFQTQAGYGQKQSDPHEPPMLFHLEIDPGEKRNLAAKHPEVIDQIRTAVKAHESMVEAVPSQLEATIPAPP